MKTIRPDWLSIVLQFAGFVLIYLLLGMVSLPWLLKLVLAFALAGVVSLGISKVLATVRRRAAQLRVEPKRIRVISVETVDD